MTTSPSSPITTPVPSRSWPRVALLRALGTARVLTLKIDWKNFSASGGSGLRGVDLRFSRVGRRGVTGSGARTTASIAAVMLRTARATCAGGRHHAKAQEPWRPPEGCVRPWVAPWVADSRSRAAGPLAGSRRQYSAPAADAQMAAHRLRIMPRGKTSTESAMTAPQETRRAAFESLVRPERHARVRPSFAHGADGLFARRLPGQAGHRHHQHVERHQSRATRISGSAPRK